MICTLTNLGCICSGSKGFCTGTRNLTGKHSPRVSPWRQRKSILAEQRLMQVQRLDAIAQTPMEERAEANVPQLSQVQEQCCSTWGTGDLFPVP